MKCLQILMLLMPVSLAANAQYSLKKFDINKTTVQSGSSYAGGFTAFRGKTYFYATDGIHGNELWWSDGDTVVMVADIFAGGQHGVTTNSKMCVLNDKLYLSADDGVHGQELFEYDGIHPPVLALDINTGPGNGAPRNFTVSGGYLFFVADAGTQGPQVWRYSPATHQASPITSGLSGIADPVVFNDKIVLGAINFPYNVEPCEYDLNTKGFKMLEDLNPGIDGSWPMQFMVAFNRVFFVAMTPTYGAELYQYTGTGLPKRLTDLNPGWGNSVIHTPGFRSSAFMPCQGRLYFTGYVGGVSYDLCYYEPAIGTVAVAYPMTGSKAASEFEEYHGRLFFSMDSNMNGITSLYAYDGNAAYNISALGVPNTFVNPMGTKACNGRLFFSADDSTDNEVYVFTDSAALGINHIRAFIADVQLYPNPFFQKAYFDINLKQTQRLDIRCTDITGKTLYSTGLKTYAAADHKIELPLQNLSAGNYVCTILDAAGNILYSGKLTKE